MSFPSFHKVRDNLVLEELTIGPDMVALLPHAFYSNNIPVLPARAPSRPPGNGGQGQEHGHDRCRYRKYDGRRHNAFGQGNKPCPAPPPWPSFYNSWTKTINMYPSLASEGGEQQHRLPQQQVLISAPGLTMVGPPFTPPLALILTPSQMYTAQQQHATSPSWTLWHVSWDQQSLPNSFNTMTLQMLPSLMEWVTDSGASNHTTFHTGNISLF
jgi:hypothetical protein